MAPRFSGGLLACDSSLLACHMILVALALFGASHPTVSTDPADQKSARKLPLGDAQIPGPWSSAALHIPLDKHMQLCAYSGTPQGSQRNSSEARGLCKIAP